MIVPVSILVLASSIGMGILAVMAITLPRRHTRTTVFFALFCASAAIWSAASMVSLNVLSVPDPSLGEPYSAAHVIALFMALGLALTPTFWALFALERAGLSAWTRGWRGWLVGSHAVYAFLLIVTNPFHHASLYLNESGAIAIGALGVIDLLWALTLGVVGMVLLVRHEWSRETPTGRHRAGLLLLSATLVIVGIALWGGQGALGSGAESFALAPALFLAMAIVLAHDVIRYGIADVTSSAAEAVFDVVSDGLILVDTSLMIVSINPVARRILPEADEDIALEDASRELAQHASFCVRYSCDELAFEAQLGTSVFWGRARRTMDDNGEPTGVLIALTDLTELRDAQTRLLATGGSLEDHALGDGHGVPPRKRAGS